MKKSLSLLLALVMLFGLSTFAMAEEKTEIVVWCWDPAFNIYAMEEAKKIYEAENPNVTIKIEEVASDDIATRLTAALGSGQTDTLPDIALMQDNSGRKFTGTFEGSFFDMKDLVNYDDFAAYKVKHFAHAGGNYAVPFDNGAAALFIRTDFLEDAGYKLEDVTDITWDRFIEIGIDVKEKTGKYLLSSEGTYNDFMMMMLQSANSWFFDAEGNPNIAGNPVVKKATETVVKLRQSGIVMEAADWTEYISGFNNGHAAGTAQGCWIIGSIVLSEDQAGKWAMTTLPRLDMEEGTNYSSQGGSSWMVLASSKHPEAAVDFLNKTFAGSVDFYQTILEASGAIATYLPAQNGAAYKEPHAFFNGQKVFEDLMDYSTKIPMVEYGLYNYEARDKVMIAVEEVMNGGDIDQALQTAQASVEFLMEE